VSILEQVVSRYSSDGSTLGADLPASGSALLLTGATNSNASTPDHASLDITGDLDLRAHVAMDDWTPTAEKALLSKWTTSGNQKSYLIRVGTTGLLRFYWSADGAATLVADSTIAPTVVDGAALWVRATLDVNNGAAGRDIRFYTSTDGETWIQLGATVTQAGVTSVFSSNAGAIVGALDSGASARFEGKVHAVEIRNGIDGTVVARPEFGAQPAGTTSIVDSTGKTWTIQAAASIVDVANTLFPDALNVVTPTGPVWSGVDAPFDIMVGGERIRVTVVTGTTSPQTFTVTRSINGVVKGHSSGADVELFHEAIYAL
jgi:hypothetical protein